MTPAQNACQYPSISFKAMIYKRKNLEIDNPGIVPRRPPSLTGVSRAPGRHYNQRAGDAQGLNS